MSLTLSYDQINLQFSFSAGTSRGELTEKTSWILRLSDGNKNGYGEAGPLPGLSIDANIDFPEVLLSLAGKIADYILPETAEECLSLVGNLCGEKWPSVRFALESAFLDLLNGGKQMLFSSSFTRGEQPVPINGLIWMGSPEFMRSQIRMKLDQGYTCLKMKIGALDFEEEIRLLQEIRKEFTGILRVDANGAFQISEADRKLRRLAAFDLHSIEQPIAAGNHEAMTRICKNSPVPVALDEELIGVPEAEAEELLYRIKPHYIILKPTLAGGIDRTRKWIDLASSQDIGWWMTSALESNIGLNVISQLTASLPYHGHQGLGTGSLYKKNFTSPLYVEKGYLYFDPGTEWEYLPELPLFTELSDRPGGRHAGNASP